MYEMMAVWETPEVIPGFTPAMLDFARIWQTAEKIVYSKSRNRGRPSLHRTRVWSGNSTHRRFAS